MKDLFRSRDFLRYRPKRVKRHTRLIKTSDTHPIRVDMLPLPVDIFGTIGLTLAPGKKFDGFTGRWERDLDKDLRRLEEEYRTDYLVSLMEAHEYENCQIADLFPKASKYGIQVIWHPIEDETAPQDTVSYFALIKRIVRLAAYGNNVVIHCRGGIGRTGMTGSCCLVELGFEPYEAIHAVRRARPGTITRQTQIDLVWQYAREMG